MARRKKVGRRTPKGAPSPPGPSLLFDGHCNLCSGSVRFLLDHESDQDLRFASLQSPAGERLGRQFGFDPGRMDTLVLIEEGRVFDRSDAVLRLARHLRGAWRLVGLARIIPRPLRDWLYDRVARGRYRWFGRSEVCLAPRPDLTARFIQE